MGNRSTVRREYTCPFHTEHYTYHGVTSTIGETA